MKQDEPRTHVFLKPCGCLASAIVNVPDMFGELAKEQRYAKKHDYTYKLMETEDVRHMDWLCSVHRAIYESKQTQKEVMERIKGNQLLLLPMTPQAEEHHRRFLERCQEDLNANKA